MCIPIDGVTCHQPFKQMARVCDASSWLFREHTDWLVGMVVEHFLAC